MDTSSTGVPRPRADLDRTDLTPVSPVDDVPCRGVLAGGVGKLVIPLVPTPAITASLPRPVHADRAG